jgi:hypothetical protein
VVLPDRLCSGSTSYTPANQFLVVDLGCISDTLFELSMLSLSARAFIWSMFLPLANITFSISRKLTERGVRAGSGIQNRGCIEKVFLRLIRPGNELFFKRSQVGLKVDSQPSSPRLILVCDACCTGCDGR